MSSIWFEDIELPSFPKLKADIKTDVLIIGGGIAGILTAYMLHERNVPYVLVEKDRICGGTTGNTTAKINVSHGLIYSKLLKSGSVQKAKMYLDANQAAFEKFLELCSDIDCDYERRDNYVYTTDDRKKLWIIIEAVDENNKPVPFGTQSAKLLLTNLANKICPIIRFEITDRVILHNELCPCGNDRPWLEIEGRTDDILTFSNGVRIAPLSVYAILKEVHGMKRFQLVKKSEDVLELRIISEDKQGAFNEASAALTKFLSERGINAEIILSDKEPSANPFSGKFKHIICK